jgi:hypothetical protein
MEYANKDSRIRVENNRKFLPLMENWNHALRQISEKSKYVKVVHADDWLFPECLTRMVDVGEKHPTVGIIGAYRLEEKKVTLDGLPYSRTCLRGREICRMYFLQHISMLGSPTSLLIRSDEIRHRGAFYNPSNLHADVEVCFDIFKEKDFGFVHQVLTFTRRHNEAMSGYSNFLGTNKISNLILLKKYGNIYLSPEEIKRVEKRFIHRYYLFLARRLFWMRKREFYKRKYDFFNFHKKESLKLGLTLSWVELMKFTLVLILLDSFKRIKCRIEI